MTIPAIRVLRFRPRRKSSWRKILRNWSARHRQHRLLWSSRRPPHRSTSPPAGRPWRRGARPWKWSRRRPCQRRRRCLWSPPRWHRPRQGSPRRGSAHRGCPRWGSTRRGCPRRGSPRWGCARQGSLRWGCQSFGKRWKFKTLRHIFLYLTLIGIKVA